MPTIQEQLFEDFVHFAARQGSGAVHQRDPHQFDAAFITEQSIVTDQVISAATTARLEALDLELFRWEGVHKDEIKAFGGG